MSIGTIPYLRLPITNTIFNGDGSDNHFVGTMGDDTFNGQGGTDTADYSATTGFGGVQVDLSVSTAQNTFNAGTDTLLSIENLVGSNQGDTLYDGPGVNVIYGDAGGGTNVNYSDHIILRSGGDTYYGGAVSSSLISASTASDLVYGGTAGAILDFSPATGGLNIDFSTGHYTHINNVLATSFDDVFTGDQAVNNVNGSGGDDILSGASGADILAGYDGDDLIYGGSGGDILNGVAGDDALYGGSGDDTLQAGDDTDMLFGGSGDDNEDGGAGSDTLVGGSGVDILNGATGSDVLDGSDDKDLLNGGLGGDRITGGAGRDTIDGGQGADTIRYASVDESTSVARDIVRHFDFSQDRFDTPVVVTGIDGPVTVGALSRETFDDDLAAAVTGLAPDHALLFTPSSGNLSGKLYLVIDGNDQAGYQAGADIVMDLVLASNVGSLGVWTFI